MIDNTEAVVATVQHAVRLADKANRLVLEVKESLAVAASLAGENGEFIDPTVLYDLVQEARAVNAPGRLGLTQVLNRIPANRSMCGKQGHKDRLDGSRWPPPADMVYMLENHDGEIIYVGKTKRLSARMQGHGTKPWARVHWRICADRDEASKLEADLIYQYQPPLNVVGRAQRMERTA